MKVRIETRNDEIRAARFYTAVADKPKIYARCQ